MRFTWELSEELSGSELSIRFRWPQEVGFHVSYVWKISRTFSKVWSIFSNKDILKVYAPWGSQDNWNSCRCLGNFLDFPHQYLKGRYTKPDPGFFGNIITHCIVSPFKKILVNLKNFIFLSMTFVKLQMLFFSFFSPPQYSSLFT